jgi:DNA-binding transcriptional LysR family regulator
MLHAGLDLSRRKVDVCLHSETGEHRDQLAATRRRLELTTEHFDFKDPSGGLREHRTDVAIVGPPFVADGLEMLVIATEDRYAVVAADHPLAQRPSVDFADLAGEPWMDIATDPAWCDFWRVAERRSEPVKVGATCRTLDDLL